MQEYRSDRVVKLLTVCVSIVYVLLWTVGLLVLLGAPALKVFAGGDPDWQWGLPVDATAMDTSAPVVTSWGEAHLEVEDVRGSLKLPLGILPWWLFGVLWMHVAVAFGLMLLFMHHLRRIFQSARAGAPFDAANATRLRWLGFLLLGLAVFNGIAEFITAMIVRGGLTTDAFSVPAGLHIDLKTCFIGLVLVALAEVFRRGADLEDEQSLVV